MTKRRIYGRRLTGLHCPQIQNCNGICPLMLFVATTVTCAILDFTEHGVIGEYFASRQTKAISEVLTPKSECLRNLSRP